MTVSGILGATCDIPLGWSINRACVALCARASAMGQLQAAKFNWVLLIARPSMRPSALVVAYMAAARRRAETTDDLVAFDPESASGAGV